MYGLAPIFGTSQLPLMAMNGPSELAVKMSSLGRADSMFWGAGKIAGPSWSSNDNGSAQPDWSPVLDIFSDATFDATLRPGRTSRANTSGLRAGAGAGVC